MQADVFRKKGDGFKNEEAPAKVRGREMSTHWR
jgi:hypothetical protein